ncbi:MAG: glycosyltransferase [Burkholderiales bacterium]|nr:glycosyltransferase [Burkholderiales bacterium]
MISVLVPVYHVPLAWFSQCLASIEADLARLEAEHPGDTGAEVVLVNDGCSQTDLLAYLHALEGQSRYRVIHAESNLGVPGALNLGLDACQHELVARVDADDITLPGRFVAQWQAMQASPEIDVLGTALNYYRQQPNGAWAVGETIRHPPLITREIALRSRWFMNHGTVMYRRSVIQAAGGYDATLRGKSEDFELWVRLLRNGRCLRNLPMSCYLVRLRAGSVSQQFTADNEALLRATQATLLAANGMPD